MREKPARTPCLSHERSCGAARTRASARSLRRRRTSRARRRAGSPARGRSRLGERGAVLSGAARAPGPRARTARPDAAPARAGAARRRSAGSTARASSALGRCARSSASTRPDGAFTISAPSTHERLRAVVEPGIGLADQRARRRARRARAAAPCCERPYGHDHQLAPASTGSRARRGRQLALPEQPPAVELDAVHRAGAAARARPRPRPPSRAQSRAAAQKRTGSLKRHTTSPLAMSIASSVPSPEVTTSTRPLRASCTPLSPRARKRQRGWPVRRSIATRCWRRLGSGSPSAAASPPAANRPAPSPPLRGVTCVRA